jgi:hypothetical protein
MSTSMASLPARTVDMTLALVPHLPWLPGRVWEPACGSAFGRLASPQRETKASKPCLPAVTEPLRRGGHASLTARALVRAACATCRYGARTCLSASGWSGLVLGTLAVLALQRPIRCRLRVVGGHRRLVGAILRRAALDIEVAPHAHRDDAGVDVVLALQRSHRGGKPRLVVGLLGGAIGRRFRLACHSALIPDGDRWCKSDIGADGGGKEKAPACFPRG